MREHCSRTSTRRQQGLHACCQSIQPELQQLLAGRLTPFCKTQTAPTTRFPGRAEARQDRNGEAAAARCCPWHRWAPGSSKARLRVVSCAVGFRFEIRSNMLRSPSTHGKAAVGSLSVRGWLVRTEKAAPSCCLTSEDPLWGTIRAGARGSFHSKCQISESG